VETAWRPRGTSLTLALSFFGSEAHTATRRDCRPGPRGVWAVAPAVSTPHCLRGTRQDLPCTSAGNPAPRVKSTPPAGPRAQGWTGPPRTQGSNLAEVVEVHPLAISQDRPSRPKPPGQGRSSGRALHLDPGPLPSYPEGGRRREDEPPPGECAFARIPEDDEHQGDRGPTPCHPCARTGPEQGTLSTSQAPGKPELTRGTAVGYRL
jgi:hypothetical protein